ncbi:MAG: hypothetical protein R8N23_15630 [Reichenbachiella sp.]|uniref:hypothetical protein n=1 Tax=Reichenbachiella sp. TaxID=2184521 RepID=UPI0029671C48|nr:hypothetical protein [Reichenbachiella sp.]MDW3211306.1 hypothetical protein [Reichenbachiella sp.]
MKVFALILSVLGLTILGYLIIQGGKVDTTQSSIFMHPSNYDKVPTEQVIKMEEKENQDIPKWEELVG